MLGRRNLSTARPALSGILRGGILLLTVFAVTAVTAFAQLPESEIDDEATEPQTQTLSAVDDAQVDDEAILDSVSVTLIPYEIEMPETLPPGSTTFKITNEGSSELGFAIEGENLAEEVSPIAAGESQSLTVELQPGTYTVYCPVSDLRERGMETTVTVEENGVEGGEFEVDPDVENPNQTGVEDPNQSGEESADSPYGDE